MGGKTYIIITFAVLYKKKYVYIIMYYNFVMQLYILDLYSYMISESSMMGTGDTGVNISMGVFHPLNNTPPPPSPDERNRSRIFAKD